MTVYYEYFYRKNGIRTASHLMTPPLSSVDVLELPKQSILHYTTSSPIESGPAVDEFLFRNIKRPIMIEHVVENGDVKGSPRHLAISPDVLVRNYHIKYRRYRNMRSLEAASRDPNTLIVINYGIIPKLYKYMRSFYSEYYKWWNINVAVWKKINELCESSDRQQFLVCNLPVVLPSIPDLYLGSSIVSQRTVKIFNSPESLMLLELWKWLGENRKDSIISHIPEKKLDKVNIIFQESGRWFVLNLGRINAWRIATTEELEAIPDLNTKGIQPQQIQRRFLRLMMSLFQVKTVSNVMPSSTETKDVKTADNTPVVVKQDPVVPELNNETGAVGVSTQIQELPDEAQTSTVVDNEGSSIHHNDEIEQQLSADLAELENISNNYIEANFDQEQNSEPEQEIVIKEAATLEDGVMNVCDRLADNGLLSAAEYRRYGELAKKYRTIIAPNGKETLDKFIKINPKSLLVDSSHEIQDIKTVTDKSMLRSSLHDFDRRYIKEVMAKDVAGMVMNIQNAGIAVVDYEVEHNDEILGSFDMHTVRITPVEGTSSTFRFKLPVLEEDGSFKANGIKYRMRKQRGDLPIRKISPDRVALTSYYGKIFAGRSIKKVNDYGQWLRNSIMAKGLAHEDEVITELQPSPVFDNTFKAPRLYSAIAMGFRGFAVKFNDNSYALSFDHTKRELLYGKDAISAYEKDGAIIVGTNTTIRGKGLGSLGTIIYLVMDRNNVLYTGLNGNLTDFVTIEEFLELEIEKAPIDFAELKIMGRDIPIGIIFGYEMGLSKLMKSLNVVPRRVNAGTRVNLENHEYAIVFSDETLVFSKDDKKASMILAGFNEYHKTLRGYSVYDFDKRGIYLNVLESGGASTRYLRELDLLYRMFIDPITHELLVEMKEPVDFHGLLVRCCELLMDDSHPDELDPASMRIKGYERMAGAVYSEMIKSIRSHNGRPGKSKHPIDLNPYSVWKNISQDPSIAIVSDINPIENLKEVEAVTYSGVGGRNSRSMTKHTRAYHQNDMGTISEATVDSSDVGINTFTSADPQLTSLRGMSKRFVIGKNGPTSLLSTSALTAPCSDMDDPKRVNFVSIQNSHSVSCSGYRQASVRTGYEQVIAHRTSDMYAVTAKKPGKVVSVSDIGMVVEYDDGEIKGYELGRRFGNAAGLVIPHSLVTEMKVGQVFKEGDIVCFNKDFFEKDLLNANNVVMKSGIIVKTALLESTATLEDSSSISAKTASMLSTKVTKVKDIVIKFDQSVHKLIKSGTNVKADDILCIIEDAVTANSGVFDEESLDTLRILGAQTPQAKAKGLIERIEFFYHGDKEDMSESLRTIANDFDRELGKRNRAIGKKAFTGSVDEGFRVDGDPLTLDTAVIRVYITVDANAGIGDKGVFANQMKTVFGEVLSGKVSTESGQEIDAIFGMGSIYARIVNSPALIGTTNVLLDVIGKAAVKLYREK